MTADESCKVCGRVDHPAYQCWRVGHLINEATAKANPEYAMPVGTVIDRHHDNCASHAGHACTCTYAPTIPSLGVKP